MSDEELDEIDRIYHDIDARLRGGRFSEVDAILGGLDVEALSVVEMLAYLSITIAAPPELLPLRAIYARRVRARLTETDRARVEDLLRGIE